MQTLYILQTANWKQSKSETLTPIDDHIIDLSVIIAIEFQGKTIFVILSLSS